MDEIEQKIKDLSPNQVAEAVKNLGLTLQADWEHEIEDDEVIAQLQTTQPSGPADELRRLILSGGSDEAQIERWGKGLLRYSAAEPGLRSYADEAIDDAVQAEVKLMGVGSVIVIGIVLVALKYRPKSFTFRKRGSEIDVMAEWEDNDTRAVSDLAKLAASCGA